MIDTSRWTKPVLIFRCVVCRTRQVTTKRDRKVCSDPKCKSVYKTKQSTLAMYRNKAGGVYRFGADDWFRMVRKYNYRCAYCRSEETLTLDHVIPLFHGGTHSIGNFVPACEPCNNSKGRKLIIEWKQEGLTRERSASRMKV